MATNIYRGPLTDAMLVALSTGLATYANGNGIPIGDGVIPAGAAWNGEPNAPTSTFQPYVVLIAGPANNSMGAVADSQADWRFPYMLGSYSSSRKALEWMADRARDVLGDLRGTVYFLGEDKYKVINVRVESIGGTNRVDQTDPPFWGQTDSLTMWMGKEQNG